MAEIETELRTQAQNPGCSVGMCTWGHVRLQARPAGTYENPC